MLDILFKTCIKSKVVEKIRFLGQTLIRLTMSAGKQKGAYHGEREVKLGWVGFVEVVQVEAE